LGQQLNSYPRMNWRLLTQPDAARAALFTPHAPGAETHYHLVGALVSKRLSEQIALDGIAPEVAHALEILGGLDTFRGDGHAEALCKLNDRLDDRHIFGP